MDEFPEDDVELAEWLLAEWDEGRGKSQLERLVWNDSASYGRRFDRLIRQVLGIETTRPSKQSDRIADLENQVRSLGGRPRGGRTDALGRATSACSGGCPVCFANMERSDRVFPDRIVQPASRDGVEQPGDCGSPEERRRVERAGCRSSEGQRCRAWVSPCHAPAGRRPPGWIRRSVDIALRFGKTVASCPRQNTEQAGLGAVVTILTSTHRLGDCQTGAFAERFEPHPPRLSLGRTRALFNPEDRA